MHLIIDGFGKNKHILQDENINDVFLKDDGTQDRP